MTFIQNIDNNILQYIQENIRNSFLDNVMPIITSLGNMSFIWIICGVVLLISKRYRKYGCMIFCALIFCALIGNLTLKPLVARVRPFNSKPLIDGLLIAMPKDYSFPSGHTMCSFAPTVVLFYMNRKIGIAALVISSLIGFSRLYLYVHYPSDVIAGMMIGIINGILAIIVVKKCYQKM